MFRILVGLAAVACLIAPFSGCTGDKENGGSAQSKPPAEAHDHESHSKITPKTEAPETVADVYIKPYFDEAAASAELAVAPGQTFDFYVFAEFPEPFQVSAAEYRLKLPAGVKVVDETKFKDKVLSMGNHQNDFVVAFQCEAKGGFYLVKYECSVEAGFKGGMIEVLPGVNSAGVEFLGFVTCEPNNSKIPAVGGSVTLGTK